MPCSLIMSCVPNISSTSLPGVTSGWMWGPRYSMLTYLLNLCVGLVSCKADMPKMVRYLAGAEDLHPPANWAGYPGFSDVSA